MVGLIGHTLVQFVDNAMVGRLGTAELAAISLGNSFIFLAMSFGIGFSTAITPLISESDAKKDYQKTKDVLLNGILICTILGIILSLAVLIFKPIIFQMGQPEDVVNLAFPYITWVAISLVPLVIFQSFKQFSDGLSLTKISMISTIIANIINVIKVTKKAIIAAFLRFKPGSKYIKIFGKNKYSKRAAIKTKTKIKPNI